MYELWQFDSEGRRGKMIERGRRASTLDDFTKRADVAARRREFMDVRQGDRVVYAPPKVDAPTIAGEQGVTPSTGLNVGNEYDVVHCRKGSFRARILAIEGEWVDAVITAGQARNTVNPNVEVGEQLRMRGTFCTFSPVPKGGA